jgi:glycosyltransferase involved in cell wall biosynthesis
MAEVDARARWYDVHDRQPRPTPALTPPSPLDAAVHRATDIGLRRIDILAWRDLDDPEAGGSELHAHRLASLWAAAGLDVTLRTSAVAGQAHVIERDGYKVVRRSGRYGVFPTSALRGAAAGRRRPDGLVEVWNGMPFFSPLWARCARIVFLHHVHAEMWRMALPPTAARAGALMERTLAPPLYRRTRVVTLSPSSRADIVSTLGLRHHRVSVVPPGVDPAFTPSGPRSPVPMVVAVGRLVPVKRFDVLIGALAEVRRRFPTLRAVIVGDGYERAVLEAKRRAVGAQDWLELPGRVDDAELRALYRRAWVLASTSQREGWGMTITEAGACGTPAVVTRIVGHRDAVAHDVSGLLVDQIGDFAGALEAVLGNDVLRRRLGAGAKMMAARFTWEAAAAGALGALVEESTSRSRRHRGAIPPST